jgi:hypothetical protein
MAFIEKNGWKVIIKGKDEVFDVDFDYISFLKGATIITSEWAGDLISNHSFSNQKTTVWLEGGQNGKEYIITNVITTDTQLTISRSFKVHIKEHLL